MRQGKIKIKKYKTGRKKTGLVLLSVLLLAAGLFYFTQGGKVLLPPFAASLTKEEMQHQARDLSIPGLRYFALQLGVFSEKEGARTLAESYRSRGAGGFIYSKDGYRVLAAAYENREDASAVQQRLSREHGVDAHLLPLSTSTVTLHLTGQKAQLDALSDALDLCSQLISTLSHLSNSLDDGSMDPAAVAEALRSQLNTVRTVSARLTALFGKEDHPAVTGLSVLLNASADNLAAALDAANATRLSSGLKYSHLHLVCGMEEYVAALTAAP